MGKSAYKLAAVLLLGIAASTSLAAQRAFDKRFDVSPGGQLIVDTSMGSVEVVGQDSREVAVHAEITGSNAFVDRFKITAEQESSGVTVRSDTDSFRSWLDWFFPLTRVSFVISVPRDYRVDVHTSGGRIEIRSLTADAKGRTSGGGIYLEDITGSIDMRTSGGGIHGNGLKGPAELKTSGGGIHLENCTGDLDVRTSGGGIRLQGIDGHVTARTSGGGITVEARSNRGISLATSGGSITLFLPQTVHASVDAWTSGGRVHVDLPMTSTEIADHSHVRGAINGGGEPIVLHTAGAGIHVGPL